MQNRVFSRARNRVNEAPPPSFPASSQNKPVTTLGVMGGNMQPQGHTQVMVRLADYGQNAQSAMDGPRFRFVQELEINLEPEFPRATVEELARRGHRIAQLPEGYMDFGCGQLIWRLEDGYAVASDARRDSLAVGF